MTWRRVRRADVRPSVVDGAARTHHGSEHSALKNIAPHSFTARSSSERASMASRAAVRRSMGQISRPLGKRVRGSADRARARGRAAKTGPMVPGQCRPCNRRLATTALKERRNRTDATDRRAKLHDLLGRAIVDFGGASIAPLVLIGDRLGLYRALAQRRPRSRRPSSPRARAPRALRARMAQRAGRSGYVTYDPRRAVTRSRPSRRSRSPNEDSPASRRRVPDRDRRRPHRRPAADAFRTGEGIGWHEHDHRCSTASSGSSARRTSATSCRAGFRRSTASRRSCKPGYASPTSAAATAPRRS